MDLVIMKDGKIFNKFPTNEKFLKNKWRSRFILESAGI